MNTICRYTLLSAALVVATGCTQSRREATVAAPLASAPEAVFGANLLKGLGDHHFPITTRSPEAQRWFDQGLMLTMGFNHDAAERSFLRAAQFDPDCAMCWWGASLVLGPHVNAGMDPENNARAWSRLQKARALAGTASPREQAFIESLSARYGENPPEDRRPLDEAYAVATRQMVQQRPDDLDAAVFHAEALMDLQPWAYYDEQRRPVGNTDEIVSVLESVMARDPDHAGALHLYVHAVEASDDPQRGVDAADRLRELIPGSGHLVHMPAHIYARVGRWHDAVIANERAIEADDAYLAVCRGNTGGIYPLGYVPHNHHFLWFAASMEGNSETARSAALETARRTDLPELMRKPGFGGLQHYWMSPWFDRVRFGRWDEIAATPNPAGDLLYVTAIWHYAQGFAAANQQREADARRHLRELRTRAADPVLETMTMWDRYPLTLAATIAERSLTAEIARAAGDREAAVAALRQAAAIEDKIPYDEPPGWHAPVRHSLGALLLEAGRADEAEAVYREELARNPFNGWSLRGLAQSLEDQGRSEEAAETERQRRQAWQHADVELVASRF
ncbi:MAG: hypothetical protein M3Q42_03035 [Pseudomonadota bacterium]|nr:hypothetical protein [Pseudomonadota bacterium]